MIGEKFGKLIVISECIKVYKKRGKRYLCQCDCGSQVIVRSDFLKSGNTKSCGCLLSKYVKPSTTKEKHGMSRSKEFASYNAMKTRCYNPNSKHYHNYGGRGIKVCDEWINSFTTFYNDMGSKPNDMTLDRINVNGDYEPSNCKWSTRSEQNKNRRKYKCRKKSLDSLCTEL